MSVNIYGRNNFGLILSHSVYKFTDLHKERKGKEEYLYIAFLAKEVHSKRSGMDHTVLPANNTMPAFPS